VTVGKYTYIGNCERMGYKINGKMVTDMYKDIRHCEFVHVCLGSNSYIKKYPSFYWDLNSSFTAPLQFNNSINRSKLIDQVVPGSIIQFNKLRRQNINEFMGLEITEVDEHSLKFPYYFDQDYEIFLEQLATKSYYLEEILASRSFQCSFHLVKKIPVANTKPARHESELDKP
jgi:hypothetical protein